MWCGFNGGWGNGWWGGYSGYGGIGWWFMPIIMIVVLGLIIWGIVMLVRRTAWAGGSGWGGSSTVNPNSAIEILKRRYARGEISKEEFDERKKNLV